MNVQDNNELTEQRLALLQRDYVQHLPEQLLTVAAGWQRICHDEDGTDAIASLTWILHGLSGSALTFGCNSVADIARRFESLLKQAAVVGWQRSELFLQQGGSYVRWLNHAAAQETHGGLPPPTEDWLEGGPQNAAGDRAEPIWLNAQQQPTLPAPGATDNPCLLYVLDNDRYFVENLQRALGNTRYTVEAFSQAPELELALRRQAPDAAIIHLNFIEHYSAEVHASVPLLWVGESDDIDSRLCAVRAGGTTYFSKTAPLHELLQSLDALHDQPTGETYRVGIVDDDAVSSLIYCKYLEKQGMRVLSVTDPLTAVRAFDQFQPELIIMDVYMHGCNGLELAMVLRQMRRYDDVPIIFLSAETDFDKKLAAVKLGGDDFLTKPITVARLLEAILPRAKRARVLRQSRVRQRQAIQEAQQLMFALDQHAIVSMADQAGDIIYANEKFCRISGYTRAELLGKNHRIVKGHAPPEMYVALWHTIGNGQVWQGTLCNRSKTGTDYWVETTIVPIVDDVGQFLRYISIRTDVTHLQKMQEQLLSAKEEAERANQAKSEFLSRMSHELRTPLNAILGFSQLLSSDPDEPLSAEQSDNVRQIEGAGWHLLELINEVLDLSKIEAGRISIHLEAVVFAEVLAECRDLITPLATQRGITWQQDIAGAGTRLLWVDRMRFKQVLLNLLSNAVKYNRAAGRIHVSCEPVANKLRIAVADQGQGLTEEQLAHLFEPFNRLDAEHSNVQGTGIGLVITKGLVTALGGTIEVSSTPGEGSVFSVLLPVAGGANPDLAETPLAELHDEIVETLLRA